MKRIFPQPSDQLLCADQSLTPHLTRSPPPSCTHGLPAQLGVDEGELEEGEGGQEVEEVFNELGRQLGEAGLTSLGVHHCPLQPGRLGPPLV